MAGGAGNARPGAIIEGINVTPLVDIMLVLLVIFIVTAKILVLPAVPLDLPKVSKSDEVHVVFSVAIPASGATTVNGAPISDDDALERAARGALAKDPGLRGVIQADGAVAHARVLRVLDRLRVAGLEKVAFATAPLDERPR